MVPRIKSETCDVEYGDVADPKVAFGSNTNPNFVSRACSGKSSAFKEIVGKTRSHLRKL